MEIVIDNPSVKSEFVRWCDYFGNSDPYTANGNIGIQDVLRAHFLIADYFYAKGYGMSRRNIFFCARVARREHPGDFQ
jgi:hypothetical protein